MQKGNCAQNGNKMKYVLISIFITGILFACDAGYSESTFDDSCIPDDFLFNSSMNQAAYFFFNVTLDNVLIDGNDWVGAFNGDVCVGSRNWGACENEACDVPVLGTDGATQTIGYMSGGDIPSFKIFRASDLTYYDANASEDISYVNNLQLETIDLLSGCTNSSVDLGCGCGAGVPSGCDNECGSTAETDECGICDGPGAIYECGCENIELGCDQVCGSGAIEGCNGICYLANQVLDEEGVFYDCNGVCGGDAYLDCAGTCDNNSNNDVGHDFDQDGICDNSDLCVGTQYYDNENNLICLAVEQPEGLSLKQNYPNPFNPSTTIEFSLDINDNIELIIYDIRGEKIKTLVSDFILSGSHIVVWDGRNNNGFSVPSGVYIASLELSNAIFSKKLTLIR